MTDRFEFPNLLGATTDAAARDREAVLLEDEVYRREQAEDYSDPILSREDSARAASEAPLSEGSALHAKPRYLAGHKERNAA